MQGLIERGKKEIGQLLKIKIKGNLDPDQVLENLENVKQKQHQHIKEKAIQRNHKVKN